MAILVGPPIALQHQLVLALDCGELGLVRHLSSTGKVVPRLLGRHGRKVRPIPLSNMIVRLAVYIG